MKVLRRCYPNSHISSLTVNVGEEKYPFSVLTEKGMPGIAINIDEHKAIHGLLQELDVFVAESKQVGLFRIYVE
jgi:hypothetical protein